MKIIVEATEAEIEKIGKVLLVPEIRTMPDPRTGQPTQMQVLKPALRADIEDHLKAYLKREYVNSQIQQLVNQKRPEFEKEID